MVIKCEQWGSAPGHLARTAMMSYDESAKRAVEDPCMELSLPATTQLNSWLAERSAERPHVDLLAENIRLSKELARVERSKRRCGLQAEQRKAELEQELSSMRNLITQMLCREPSLRPLAAVAGFPLDDCSGADLSVVQPEPSGPGLEQLMSENAWLLDENRKLTAELADKACVAADSARLDYHNHRLHLENAQRMRLKGDEQITEFAWSGQITEFAWSGRHLDGNASHNVDDQQFAMQPACNQWLWTENRQLQQDKERLAAELGRAERERRRLVLLEAQSRADLEQCQKSSLTVSSEHAHPEEARVEEHGAEDAHEPAATESSFPLLAADLLEEDAPTHVTARSGDEASPNELSGDKPESADLKVCEQLQSLIQRVSEGSTCVDTSIANGPIDALDLVAELEAQWEAAEGRWRAVSCIVEEVGTQTLDLDLQVERGSSELLPAVTSFSVISADVETQTLELDSLDVDGVGAGISVATPGEMKPRETLEVLDNGPDMQDVSIDMSSIAGVDEVSAALEAMGAAVQRAAVLLGTGADVPIHPMTPDAEGGSVGPGCSFEDFKDTATAYPSYVTDLPDGLCSVSEADRTIETDTLPFKSSSLDLPEPATLHAVLHQLEEHRVHLDQLEEHRVNLRGEAFEAQEEYARSMEEHKIRLREEMAATQEECCRITFKHQQLLRDQCLQLSRDATGTCADGPESCDAPQQGDADELWLGSSIGEAQQSFPSRQHSQLRTTSHKAFEAYADLAAECERHMDSEIMAARRACAQKAEEHHRKLEQQFAQTRVQVSDDCSEHSSAKTKSQECRQSARGNDEQQCAWNAQQPHQNLSISASVQLTAALLSQQQQLTEQRAAASLAHARAEALRAELCRRQRPFTGNLLATAGSRDAGRPCGDLTAGEPRPASPMRSQPRTVDGISPSDRCCSAVLPDLSSREPQSAAVSLHLRQQAHAGDGLMSGDRRLAVLPEARQIAPVVIREDSMVGQKVRDLATTAGFDFHEHDRPKPVATSEQCLGHQQPSHHEPEARDQELPSASLSKDSTQEVLGSADTRGSPDEIEAQSDPGAALHRDVGQGTGEFVDEVRGADDAELAQEVQQLWEEERRLEASVAAVRFVSETVQAFYERQAVVAARESSEQLQEAARWHAAKAHAESRRAELAQEAVVHGAGHSRHTLAAEGFRSSSGSPVGCRTAGSMELERRSAGTRIQASSASGSVDDSSSEEESSPSSEFAFQLGPSNGLHKRSFQRHSRGDTSVWSQITRYQLAGESDNEHPESPKAKSSASGANSVRWGSRSPSRSQRVHQGAPRVGGLRSKTLPPKAFEDSAVSDGVSRRRGRARRSKSFSHTPRHGAISMSPMNRATSIGIVELHYPVVNSGDENSNTTDSGCRRIAGHRRVHSGPAFRHYSNSPVKSKHRRVPSSSGTLLQALETLTPHRRPSTLAPALDKPPSPEGPLPLQVGTRSLVEGFFHIVSGQNRAAEVQLRWPASLMGSRLEQAVVEQGFCPNPEVFSSPDPAGFSGEPFVFSLLETTLDPSGDPSGVLYGCVCSETGGPLDPCAALSDTADEHGRSLASPRSSNLPLPGVLCIVSKLPLFALLFEILGLLRGNLTRAEPLLDRICTSGFGESFVKEGVDVSDFHCGINRLRPHLPRPLLCDWQSFARVQGLTPIGAVSQTFAQWQAAWGLSALFTRWDNLVGDTLAKLLAAVLLEQKVMLLGDVPRISMMALVLRGLIWPFRWLHPYLSAPPPPDLLSMPLLEALFPLIVSLTELPKEWGYRTHYELPPEVVTGVLKHDYVYVSPELETSGGLKGTSIKLPAGRHTAFLKQVAQAKKRRRTGEIDLAQAVAQVQEAAESEIKRLVDLIRRYVTSQVAETKATIAKEDTSRFASAQREAPGSAVATRNIPLYPGISNANNQNLLEYIRESCSQQASDVETFTRWLALDNPETISNSETLSFYRTFFQTQLCLDFMNEEINAQTARAPKLT